MRFISKGTDPDSHIYFYTPNPAVKKFLYYPMVAGEFYCNSNYLVERENYDSILVIFVAEGSLTLEQKGVYTAGKNELLIVNCYEPHKYYTNEYAHTLWIHFDGSDSKEWFCAFSSPKMKCSGKTADNILEIIKDIKENRSVYDMSVKIYSLMCMMANPEYSIHDEKLEQINIAKKFIEESYQEPLTVERIAGTVNLSASYFSKIFKAAANLSPYDYLLSIRLEKAKELLRKSDFSISSIAYLTGFNSDANFIYFFKKQTGVSPLKFRNMSF